MSDLRRVQSLIRASSGPVETERVALLEAVGRVTSEGIVAPTQLPPSSLAIMGGYAVQRVRADILAQNEAAGGDSSSFPNCRVPIFPGDPLPAHTNAVIPSGTAEEPSIADDAPMAQREYIVGAGEIGASGETLFGSGRLLSPTDISLLADLGLRRVGVYKKPTVAVLTIGDEFSKVDDVLGPDKRYDSAGALISGAVVQCGGLPVQLGPVTEGPEDLEYAVRKGLEENGLVIATRRGRGRGDGLTHVLAKQGIEVIFSHVALWPGGEVLFGQMKDHPVLVLPLGAGELLVAAELLLVPLLLRLVGWKRSIRRGVTARLERTLRSPRNDVCAAWAVTLMGESSPYQACPVPQWPGGALYRSASIYGLCLSEDGSDLAAGCSAEVLPLLSRIL